MSSGLSGERQPTAVITGASEGIGLSIASNLRSIGYDLVLASRNHDKLKGAKAHLESVSRGDAAGSQVSLFPSFEAGDPEAWKDLIKFSLEISQTINVLINNAGVSGGEEMVVDLDLQKWNSTIGANFTSNYALMCSLLEKPNRGGLRTVVNVSSHFGGAKNVAVPYPNRADYAVSKAGQRAIVECFNRWLAPTTNIGCVAPGPVDGARVKGTSHSGGLYYRRAKIILENKRVNSVYKSILTSNALTSEFGPVLSLIAENDIRKLTMENGMAKLFGDLFAGKTKSHFGGVGRGLNSILDRKMFEKVLRRLELRFGFSNNVHLELFRESPEEIFSRDEIAKLESEIAYNTLKTLALGKMPSEEEVAQAAISFVQNSALIGETIHPSGGLVHQQQVSSALVGLDYIDVGMTPLQACRGLVVSGVNVDSTAVAINGLVATGASQILVCGPPKYIERLKGRLDPVGKIEFLVLGEEWESEIENLVSRKGQFDFILSRPLMEISEILERASFCPNTGLPDLPAFEKLIRNHVTSRFLTSKIGSVCKDCRVVGLNEDLPLESSALARACLELVKICTKTLTVTAGREGTRLPDQPRFHEVNCVSEVNFQRLVKTIVYLCQPPAMQPVFSMPLDYYRQGVEEPERRVVQFPGMVIDL